MGVGHQAAGREIVVAARTTGLADVQGVEAVHRASAEYRSTMSTLAELSPFEVWHSHIDVDAIVAAAPTRPARAEVQKVVAKARRRTNLQALSKLTTVVDDKRVIVEDPPLVTRSPPKRLSRPAGSLTRIGGGSTPTGACSSAATSSWTRPARWWAWAALAPRASSCFSLP